MAANRAIKFRLVRIVAIGALPEADPRASPVDPADATKVDYSDPDEVAPQLDSSQGKPDRTVRGHSFYIRFTNGAPQASAEVVGPTADVQPWVYDTGALRWASGNKEDDCGTSDIYDSSLVGTLYHQLTDLKNVGAATHIQLWVTDRTHI